MSRKFRDRKVEKHYLAVVRGYVPEKGRIDHPLTRFSHRGSRETVEMPVDERHAVATPAGGRIDCRGNRRNGTQRTHEHPPVRPISVEKCGCKDGAKGRHVEAVTEYRRWKTAELPFSIGPYSSARYSLVDIIPLTGRRHQIRRHFRHISHPVIGDTTYGDSRHNRFFREKFQMNRLLLLAGSLSFLHPYTGEPLCLESPLPDDVQQNLNDVFGIQDFERHLFTD